MEDFIENIYHYSFIISNLKEFISKLNSGHPSDARNLYNSIALDMEKWLEEIAPRNPVEASDIQDIAIDIRDCYEDQCQCKGITESRLIPALYKSISDLCTINVSEGRYSLQSSDTGFLTIKDNENGKYLHDIHDPMHEAYRITESLYKPQMERFLIFGCGLGYIAYQIYHQSDGAVRIYLYEDDTDILNYAVQYGVLSLIPDENIEIININDPNELGTKFIEDLNSSDSYGLYFSPYKMVEYDGLCNGEINRIFINHNFDIETHALSTINLWKNKKLSCTDFSAISDRFDFNEWAVISAGPSLDDRIPFLRQCKGHIGLIAVNTVLRRLLNENIVPDIVVAADPSSSLLKHIEGIEESTENITLIADWLLNWKYTSAYKGNICFVRTSASAALTKDLQSDIPVWNISGTVACLGVEAAVCLKAEKVYLIGQDLAFPSGQKYAKGMPHTEFKDAIWEIQVPSVDGSMVDTCEAFVWFRKALEYQIRKYDRVKFINMSRHGALIEGAVTEP